MKSKLRRVCSALVALTAAVSIVPLVAPTAASAAGVPAGAAEVRNPGGTGAKTSGTNTSPFTLRLPALSACAGDTANDGYFVQSYMVPASVDPATLEFDSAGPTPQDVGANFRQPLLDVNGSPYVNAPTLANPGSPRPRPGEVINIPDFTFQFFPSGTIVDGGYNIGLACTLGPPGPTQMKEFWNTTITFSSGGTAWTVGAVPAAPVLTSLTPGDASLGVAFTHAASTPATTQYTVSATPSGGGTTVTATGSASPITVAGLANGTQYDVTVRATNGAGDSPESNILQGTPNPGARPAVGNLQAVAGTGLVDLSWSTPTGPAPTGYLVEWDDDGAAPLVGSASTTSTSRQVTGLTAGTVYTFTVTPQHPAPYVGTPASVQATPFASQVVQQQVSVVRPVGALVLTQVCGAHGALAAEAAGASYPFAIPAAAASNPVDHTAPYLAASLTGAQDPEFAEYPYPTDANEEPTTVSYPTHCGVNLGRAKFVTSGPQGGKFFAATGILNQVTVVDTRDSDIGWTINGTMGTFSNGSAQFSGSQVGWTPVATDDTDPFTDSNGATYDQVVTAGGAIAPNTPNAAGLSSGQVLGGAAAGAGLGIGVLDARLKILIPVTAPSGTYQGTLSLTTI